MGQATAYNFIHVADRFGDKLFNLNNLSSSALYLLASSNTPQSAIDEALELADSGKKVTHAMAQKLVHCPILNRYN